MRISAAQLVAIMPGAGSRAGLFATPLSGTMELYGITTPLRAAAFLAQIAHESGQLRYVREVWGPTAAQLRYEGRIDLGNIQPGDGFRYRGRGLIQITGRANYAECGLGIGIDAVMRPELLEQPEYAARSAGWFWASRGINTPADAGDFERVTRLINGGLNGYVDRCTFYERAKKLLQPNFENVRSGVETRP